MIAMKKFVLFLGLSFAMQTALMAQLTGNVIFNAYLLSTFRIEVTDGGTQEITFAIAADYNNGVTEGAGILSGASSFTIEATENWNTTIQCPPFTGGSGGPIPIENLGFTITEDGFHTLAGGEVTYLAGNPDPQALTAAPAALISLGANPLGNAGDISDNAFTLHWQMGTAYLAALGTPAIGTMFDQMANGDFTTGTYITTAVLTLSSD